jgi:hypothetical protein
MTNVAVIMTTYAPEGEVGAARKNYAWESVHSLLLHLRGAEFRLHLADDGSPDRDYLRDLCALTTSTGTWPRKPSVTNARRMGIGGSLNLALDQIFERVWMYTTDDWELIERFDIEPAIQLIEKLGYDYVRLGPIHPHLMCSAEFNQEIGWWLRIHQKWGGFAFATRPFIATKEFYYNVGRFEERADSYQTEKDYNERVCQLEHLKLACLPDISGKMWRHIGIQNVGEPCHDFASVS